MIFVDEARIFLKAGSGGKGCESFYSDKFSRHPRPDGGDGGGGGDVVFVADKGIQTLLDYRFKQHYQAPKGGNASSKGKKGKVGEDLVLRVPVGTLIKDEKTGLSIKDLVSDQQSVIVAKGGQGGHGNAHRRTAPPALLRKAKRGGQPCPMLGQGWPGEERCIRLQLKLIADVGLVGFPNAGKSTLISSISKVKSKIASYPFTTKSPILGIVAANSEQNEGSGNFVVADLPGLIEGAHRGRGLGDRFLKHAERTKILVHVVDMAGTEGRDPGEDFEKINLELKEYSEDLFFKHTIVAANKMDLPGASANLRRFESRYQEEKIFPVSALKRKGLDELVAFIRKLLSTLVP